MTKKLLLLVLTSLTIDTQTASFHDSKTYGIVISGLAIGTATTIIYLDKKTDKLEKWFTKKNRKKIKNAAYIIGGLGLFCSVYTCAACCCKDGYSDVNKFLFKPLEHLKNHLIKEARVYAEAAKTSEQQLKAFAENMRLSSGVAAEQLLIIYTHYTTIAHYAKKAQEAVKDCKKIVLDLDSRQTRHKHR